MQKKKIILMLLIIGMILGIILLSGCTTKTKECSACNGTGKCNRCGGSGWAIDWDLECDRCGGTGDCPVCGGTGQISEGVPGFELILIICAIALVLFWKQKRRL